MKCELCNKNLWHCRCFTCLSCGKPADRCECRVPGPFLEIDPGPPPEILEAARVLTRWTDNHGHKFWQLMGVCDRRFVRYKETSDRAPVKPVPTCQPEPKTPPLGPIEAAWRLSSPSGLPPQISDLIRETIRIYREEEGIRISKEETSG